MDSVSVLSIESDSDCCIPKDGSRFPKTLMLDSTFSLSFCLVGVNSSNIFSIFVIVVFVVKVGLDCRSLKCYDRRGYTTRSLMNNVSLSVTTVEVLVVHAFDRVLHGLLVAEGDEAEAEAPVPPDLTVVDDLETRKETKSN
ncbi:hypothetical protein L3X38_026767 [Prunus dulcis]|uniref:Uncharacterized protein n=1 Tax=Prunus dulcis TaxID=3755 RepID=A0AAD4VML0_PRUDU|nr:hypothetical protein L3X38_026767 [Prunus dulcis]